MGMHLAQTLHGLEDARIVAVADPSEEARNKAAAAFNVPAFADYRELLERPDVRAVLVAVPNYLHRETVVAAARAARHIFCEKPMALTVADCDAMIEAAQKAGVKLMVGQVLRLIPVFAKTREIIASGALGEPICLAITRIGGGGFRGWRRLKEYVGGILFEVNAHEFDFMRSVAGEVASVYAAIGRYVEDPHDYEDTALVTLKFRSGAIGHLHASRKSEIGITDGIIQCTRGTITYNWGTNRIEYKPLEGEKKTVEPAEMPTEDGVHREMRSFVEWVLDDVPPVVSWKDGRAAVEIIEAAYRSAATGEPVELPPGSKATTDKHRETQMIL